MEITVTVNKITFGPTISALKITRILVDEKGIQPFFTYKLSKVEGKEMSMGGVFFTQIQRRFSDSVKVNIEGTKVPPQLEPLQEGTMEAMQSLLTPNIGAKVLYLDEEELKNLAEEPKARGIRLA